MLGGSRPELQCELARALNSNTHLEVRVEELVQTVDFFQQKSQHFEVLYNEAIEQKESLTKLLGTYVVEMSRLKAKPLEGEANTGQTPEKQPLETSFAKFFI